QVFGTNHVEPDRYPTAVRDVNPNDGYFEVKIFNRVTQSYHWVPVRGKLLWNGATENVLANTTIGPGNVTKEWSLQQDSQSQSAQTESFGSSTSVGVEFEVEAGFIATIQAGGSYEYSQGVTKESSRTTAWGTGFELGGGVAGFPLTVNGQNVRWPGQCQYGFQPYYYWVDDASSYGYGQSYLVLDYIVPGDRNNSFDLDRQKDLTSCRNGTYKTGANSAPDANDDGALTAPNTKITINVLTNDMDPDGDALNLQSVGAPQHGLTVIKGEAIEYTPNNGYTGSDVFTYSITDGLATSTATVHVIVGGQRVYLPALLR
ncbi:MAG TPA: Ig-like domain-containing protein, partial [Anaerolineae bacterium]|nr:Ig-like domain-containing protein [Anaerolineae bacterium]